MNLYDKLYDPKGIDYGKSLTLDKKNLNTERERMLLEEVRSVLRDIELPKDAIVLEIGASLGFNHSCHPNYHGVEYSNVAVEMAQNRYDYPVNIQQGDATKLNFKDESFDFIFTFATLEHIPEIECALSEIYRVLKKGGKALISPAWNCRKWTVEKLQDRPYSELTFNKKLAKLFIPLRNNIVFRSVLALPRRLQAEVYVNLFNSYRLRYDKLEPQFDLIEKYGHVSDDDAFVSIDAHSAITYYRSKGCKILSHPTFLKRILCRGDAILVSK